MAGDWIKMRPSLLTNPKVNGIARLLESSTEAGRVLSTGFSGVMSDIVTRNVMRNVTVACLLTVWGAANEHTADGVFTNADLSDIDDMVGVPGFGAAMEAVGWLVYDEEESSVTLPNFSEYNTCGKDRAAEKNAERQRRYREKKLSERNVTNDVTRNDREEKRREEKSKEQETLSRFDQFWSRYPNKKAKSSAQAKWLKLSPNEALFGAIMAALEAQKKSPDWTKDGGQFVPHPATWINQRRWEDEVTYAQSQHPNGQGPLSAVDRVKQAIAAREAAEARAAAPGQVVAEDDRDLRAPLDGEFWNVA